ncbi:MAG: PilN domain-containing protein [Acidobacteria bacterium]|nr:PilN domain-containing protein [Acidobacteriota bacterium]
MIRVNLLEGTAEQRVSVQKTKVAAKRGQQVFMLLSALIIATIALGIDFLWVSRAHADAKKEFEKEQEQSIQLEADNKRKEQLESELKQLEERIKLIKQLRAEQKGPVAMLSAINERMPGGLADFKLMSVSQKGSRLQIIGVSANQQVVADFARQLEFSNGLFTNVLPSIEGSEVRLEAADKKTEGEETIRLFKFTIDCDYNKPRAEGDTGDTKPAGTPAK